MSYLVTGGAGFIGSALVRLLTTRYPERQIVVLDALKLGSNLQNLASVEGAANYTFVKGDILDSGLLSELFKIHAFEGVYHLAAETHVDRSILGPEEFLEVNAIGTLRVLEAARSAWLGEGRKAGRLLHISTDEVFGSLGPDDPATDEQSRYTPNNPYSASKAAADHLVRAWNRTYGLEVVTTNCSNNFGPYQFPEKLIPVMIQKAVGGEALPVYGDGMNVRDWLYVEDHAEALDLVFQKGTPGETYNIGADNEWPNLRLVETLCDLIDEKVGALRLEGEEKPRRELINFVKDRPGHDRRYALDAGKLGRDLGWEPKHSFREALAETVDWYLANEAWMADCQSGAYQDYYEKNYAGRL